MTSQPAKTSNQNTEKRSGEHLDVSQSSVSKKFKDELNHVKTVPAYMTAASEKPYGYQQGRNAAKKEYKKGKAIKHQQAKSEADTNYKNALPDTPRSKKILERLEAANLTVKRADLGKKLVVQGLRAHQVKMEREKAEAELAALK